MSLAYLGLGKMKEAKHYLEKSLQLDINNFEAIALKCNLFSTDEERVL